LGLQIGSLFAGIREALGSLAAFSDGHISGFKKFNRLYFTKPDTLRVAVTDVAFENPPVSTIETHGTKGADADTRTAADTDIIVHRHAAQFLIPGDGFDRTNV
jgi:hypothetical protein